MRLVGVSMVKNEIDIIEYFIRHNLTYLDALLIIDNGSVDGTRELLSLLMSKEKLPLAIFDDPEMGYFQSEKTTKIVSIADSFFHPDFTFILDADEFIVAKSRETLESSLSVLPPHTVGRIKWQTYVVLDGEMEGEQNIFTKINHRRIQERPQYHKVVVPKNFSKDPENIVAQGNHYVTNKNRQIPHQILPDLVIAHFPVRSIKQLKLKILLGWMGYLAKKPNNQEGYHWKQLYDLILADKLTPITLSKISKNYAQQSDILSEFRPDELVNDPLESDIRIQYQDFLQQDEISVIIKSIEKNFLPAAGLPEEKITNLRIDWSPLKYIHEKYKPESVLEINCNKGAYVKLFKDAGVKFSLGVGTQPYDESMLCEAGSYFFYDSFDKLTADTKIEIIICTDLGNFNSDIQEKIVHFMTESSSQKILLAQSDPACPGNDVKEKTSPEHWIRYFENQGWVVNVFDSLVCRALSSYPLFRHGLTVFERPDIANSHTRFRVEELTPSQTRGAARSTNRNKKPAMSDTSSTVYTSDFYNAQKSGSYISAKIFLEKFCSIWKPSSVVDIGCGLGTWLTAFAENGVNKLVGYDGEWLSQEKMIHQSIQFIPVDLNTKITSHEYFDLAMSMEVAEHCKPESSDNFINNLVRLSDAIIFAAAYWQQPGADHINTRPHSFWAEKFIRHGYRIFDFFRPQCWGDNRIEPFYRQNTFVYVKSSHPLYQCLTANGYSPLQDPAFVDCVHPWLYTYFVSTTGNLKTQLEESHRKAEKLALRVQELEARVKKKTRKFK